LLEGAFFCGHQCNGHMLVTSKSWECL
jgi:hypothetical protein